MSEWLSPNEALPGDGKPVLYVLRTDGEVLGGIFRCGKFQNFCNNEFDADPKDVGCWMNAPAVPDWAKRIF